MLASWTLSGKARMTSLHQHSGAMQKMPHNNRLWSAHHDITKRRLCARYVRHPGSCSLCHRCMAVRDRGISHIMFTRQDHRSRLAVGPHPGLFGTDTCACHRVNQRSLLWKELHTSSVQPHLQWLKCYRKAQRKTEVRMQQTEPAHSAAAGIPGISPVTISFVNHSCYDWTLKQLTAVQS